jgi:hypothetical protein
VRLSRSLAYSTEGSCCGWSLNQPITLLEQEDTQNEEDDDTGYNAQCLFFVLNAALAGLLSGSLASQSHVDPEQCRKHAER